MASTARAGRVAYVEFLGLHRKRSTYDRGCCVNSQFGEW